MRIDSNKNYVTNYEMMTETKENKMTRDEADNIARAKGCSVALIDLLAGLGLLKFEEKKSMKDAVIEARQKYSLYTNYEEFINHLELNGYKIVPK